MNGSVQNCPNNVREYLEINIDNNTETVAVPYQEILNYLNQKSKVIDNKCAAWLGVKTRDSRPLAQFLQKC